MILTSVGPKPAAVTAACAAEVAPDRVRHCPTTSRRSRSATVWRRHRLAPEPLDEDGLRPVSIEKGDGAPVLAVTFRHVRTVLGTIGQQPVDGMRARCAAGHR